MAGHATREDEYLDILRSNRGFGAEAERWLSYARTHGFHRVHAESRERCPDCAHPGAEIVGQYVFYSTLMHLRECQRCGLWYSDCVLDDEIIAAHFSRAYKDEEYFARHRRPVFEQMSELIDLRAPRGGRVLDVGGAKGHLMAMVRERRPDLELTVSDLSEIACEWAHRTFGFQTVSGRIADLATLGRQFDVVVLSDVIYYEPDPRRLWRVLPALVRPGGALIVRAPNTAGLVRAAETLRRRLRSRDTVALADQVPFFNPEHTLLFPRKVLERRLREAGFPEVQVLPGRFGARGARARFERVVHSASSALSRVSRGRLVLAPSFVLVATRRKDAPIVPRAD